VIQYLGNGFHGWQRQPYQRTVQETLEQAIAEITKQAITVHAAGRTDAGVHAAAQIVHFDVISSIPAIRWAKVLNSYLPADLLVRASRAVPEDWHSRFSAIWRRYRYTLYTDACPNLFLRPYVWHYYHRPLDVAKIQAALEPLLGHQSLEAFQRAGSDRPHAWVEVQDVHCHRHHSTLVEIEVQASGFLYGMMRLLVGLLVQVGQGSLSLREFEDIWVNQRRDQVKHSAPAQGLCLLRVGYPDPLFPKEIWFDSQPTFSFPSLWGAAS
jgi:tRNA pseudouridine38-40 synthase